MCTHTQHSTFRFRIVYDDHHASVHTILFFIRQNVLCEISARIKRTCTLAAHHSTAQQIHALTQRIYSQLTRKYYYYTYYIADESVYTLCTLCTLTHCTAYFIHHKYVYYSICIPSCLSLSACFSAAHSFCVSLSHMLIVQFISFLLLLLLLPLLFIVLPFYSIYSVIILNSL